MWQQALQSVKDAKGCQFLDNVLKRVCRTLWNCGLSRVGAMLEEYKASAASEKPFRIWWLPTGNLSLLPIHCAGPYTQDLGGIRDLCVSSYTTTLSALIRGRKTSTPHYTAHADHSPFGILAIAQPRITGMPVLRYAAAEVQALAISAFVNQVSVRIGHDVNAEEMEEDLDRYEWLHFCCHARWDPHSPLDSAFRFADGNLTLSTIVQKRLQRAQFAFLSACHTARHTASLPDESIHLAAGMQIAGYRGLVATQWGMVDVDGPQLTALFYDHLAKLSFFPDARNAAEALHRALQQLRDDGMPLFRWALFVHIGI